MFEAVIIAIVTVAGGLLAWFLAAVFDYLSQDQRYKNEKTRIQEAVKHVPDFGKTIGEIDIYLTNLGAGPAKPSEAALRNAVQPLLVMAIIAVASFRVLTLGGWVTQLVAVLFLGTIFGLTALHESKGKTDWQGSGRYWAFVVVVWIVEAIIIIVLACSAIPAPKETPAAEPDTSLVAPGLPCKNQ